ncbi:MULTISPECIES: hypothetical protein [Rodentibacter]|uniref:Uncharacterized protein n=1 Tax=Rodentibacter pneumotropicus TaxID=758 RepID=A0A4S2PZ94_9PAST|nr:MULTISPECIES: hypothetical protein [Rodentibacter]MCQ9121614.1 hypothetical protein [Rodentibacter pneumotropicus]THA09420.1 hypothetical protein D3M77_02080 [Rodentibacter pneumotropicus]THA11297.1 hypothetical protein D3M78_00335 [Rodentibacter pneumotropicus]THA14497.1 hypothetical protein D3M76_07515 [Rodentibacter pneumotropicus]
MNTQIPQSIINIANAMKGQNNHGTSYPIYAVQRLIKEYGIDPDYEHDDATYVLKDEPDISFDNEDELKEYLVSEEGKDNKKSDFDECFYRERWETETFFFSKKAAEEFINNRAGMRFYVISAWDNHELKAIRELLLSINGDSEHY